MRRAGALLALLLMLAHTSACPTACVCKWKNGKQTVECAERGLLIIPDGMDSGTQVLEFAGNNLQTLHREKFLKMDLINLQRIHLPRCQIVSVEKGAFKGLTNLVELDLSSNALEVVPSDAFADAPSLMRLILNYNPIKSVRKEAFSQLFFLNTLEMSGCEIEAVEVGAFQGLHSLEWLRLDGNRMRGVKGARVLPDNLRGVELQGNAWECDCHLLELHAWLEGISVPQSAEPICAGPPKHLGRQVKSIPATELACLPDVSPTTFYLEIGEGKNVSLLCQINAVPEAHVSWWFQGQLLQNDTMVTTDTRLIYYVEEGVEEKKSELFIYNTNTQDNGTFVCSAENAAGVVQSNFTIRIVIKADYDDDFVAVLPFEFVLIILSATGVSLLVICFALILSIIKCHSQRRNKSKRRNLILPNSTKDSLMNCSSDDISKEGSNATLVDQSQMILYSTQTSEDMLRADQIVPPPNCYQTDQNPDLINDTERREGDGEAKTRELTSELYCLSADVHLNPIALTPYGYRTLPHNRGTKPRQTEYLYNEAEFYPDIRHTADGYPVRAEPEFTDVASCCSHWAPTKKCVGAQTQTDLPHRILNRSVCAIKISETLTESPDEGYEGDSAIEGGGKE